MSASADVKGHRGREDAALTIDRGAAAAACVAVSGIAGAGRVPHDAQAGFRARTP